MAAFDDLAGDPNAVLGDLYDSSMQRNDANIDPQFILNRLGRKTNVNEDPQMILNRLGKGDTAAPAAPTVPGVAPGTPGATPAGPDFGETATESSKAAPAPRPGSAPASGPTGGPPGDKPDFSSAAEPVAKKQEKAPALPGALGVFGNTLGQALTGQVGETMKGAALQPESALRDFNPQVAPASEVSPQFRKEAKARERQQAATRARLEVAAAVPPAERPLYKAGEAVSEFGQEKFPVSEEAKARHPIAAEGGSFIGGMVLPVAATILAGPAGAAAAAGQMGLAAQGAEFDKAISRGASIEDASKAAGESGGVAALMGILPLHAIMKPVEQGAPGLLGYAYAKLTQAAQSGITFAGVTEAQEYLGKQISQIYDPAYAKKLKGELAELEYQVATLNANPQQAAQNAKFLEAAPANIKSLQAAIKESTEGYTPSVQRMVVSLIGGGALGMMHPLHKPEPPPPPGPTPGLGAPPPGGAPGVGPGGPGTAPGGAPGSGSGAGPGSGGGGTGAGSAGTAGGTGGAGTGGAGPRYGGTAGSSGAGTPRPPPNDTPRQARMRTAFEKGLSDAGVTDADNLPFDDLRNLYQTVDALKTGWKLTPADIAAMTHAELHDLVAQFSVLSNAGHAKDDILAMSQADRKKSYDEAMKAGASAAGPEEPEAAAGAKPEEELKKKGFSDQDIGEMTPDERRLYVRAIAAPPRATSAPDSASDLHRPESAAETRAAAPPTPPQPGAEVESAPQGTGTRADPVQVRSADDVERAVSVINTDHTPAQGEANNIQRGHVEWEGLPITIEAGKGGVRRGLTPEGQPWEQRMGAHYGFIRGTVGADGMHLDVFMGEHPDAPQIYVLDENARGTDEFKQHKTFVGFRSAREAIQAYLGSTGKTRDQIRGIVPMSVDDFKNWVREGDLKNPIGEAEEAPRNAERTTEPKEEAERGAERNTPAVEPELHPEVTAEHRAHLDEALADAGVEPHDILPVDHQRALEIMASAGLPPELALQRAYVGNLIRQWGFTPAEIHTIFNGERDADVEAEARSHELRPEREALPDRGDARAEEEGRGAGGALVAGAEPQAEDGDREGAGEDGRTKTLLEAAKAGEVHAGGTAAELEDAKAGVPEPTSAVSSAGGKRKTARRSARDEGERAGEAAKHVNVEAAKSAEATKPEDGVLERFPDIEDIEVQVLPNRDGKRFGVRRYDTLDKRPVSPIQTFGSLEEARTAAREMLRGPAADEPPKPAPKPAAEERRTAALPPEHPGLVIKSLQTGKVTHLKPATRPHEDMRKRIEDAYLGITGGRRDQVVRLAQLRDALPDVSRSVMDATLGRILKGAEPDISLARNDAPSELKKADHDAAYNPAGEPFHSIFISSHQPKAKEKARPAEPAPDLGDLSGEMAGLLSGEKPTVESLRPAYEKLKEEQGGVSYVWIGRLAEAAGMPVDDVKEALVAAAARGDVHMGKTNIPNVESDKLNGAGPIKIGRHEFYTVKLMESAKPTHSDADLEAALDSALGEVKAAEKPAPKQEPKQPPKKRAEFIQGKVRDAFYEVAGRPPQDAVRLNELRAKVRAVPREEVDRALLDMKKAGEIQLMHLDNPRDINAVGGAALKEGRREYHTMWIPAAQPKAAVKASPAKTGDDVLRAVHRLEPTSNYASVDRLRKELPDVPAADLDKKIFELADAGKLVLAPYGGRHDERSGQVLAYDDQGRPYIGVAIPRDESGRTEPPPAAPVETKLDKAAKSLSSLFVRKKPPGFAEQPTADEVYEQAKPSFIDAAAHFRDALDNPTEIARRLVHALHDQYGFPADAIADMKPYLLRFVREVRDGAIDLRKAIEERGDEARPAVEGARALADVPPGESEATSLGGGSRGDDADRGGLGAAGDRLPDEAGLPSARGGRGRAGEVRVPPARAGGGRAGVATPGKRRNGAGVSESPSGPIVEPQEVPSLPAADFHITGDVNLGEGSELTKFNDNLDAIRILRSLDSEGRRATLAEQRSLARYVGWGGLANAFADPTTGEYKTGWAKRGEELKSLLSPEEIRQARQSTRNAHYTSKPVVEGMWDIAKRMGFEGGLTMELSAGIGNFIGLIPSDLAGKAKFIAVEMDGLTARIAKALYPQEAVLNAPLQNVPIPDGEAVLNIGNPPFGAESLSFQYKPELRGLSIHNQFFLTGLDTLRPNGLHIAVVSRYLLDAKDSRAREMMAAKADLLGAIRLPDTAFKENARTEVVTDIVVMRRRTPAEQEEIEGAFATRRNPKSSAGERADAEAKIPAWVKTTDVPDPLGGEPMTVNSYFAHAHPDMILGTMQRSGSMRHENDITVRAPRDTDIAKRLSAAAARLPRPASTIGDDVVRVSAERHKSMAEALDTALAGHEVGHIGFADGRLYNVMERETPSGTTELVRRPITAASPWSRALQMDDQGRWFTLKPTVNEKGEKVKEGKRNVYGRQYYENNEVPAALQLGEARFERLKEIAKLRDLVKRQLVIEAEDAPEKEMEANRKKLAAAYKDFADKHGFLNDQRNNALLSDMPDGALVNSLEHDYRPALTAARAAPTGKTPHPASAKPAPIMSRRVVPKYEAATKADTPTDALQITLSERGNVDMKRIASLLGVDEAQAIEQLQGDKPKVFWDPEAGEWQTRSDYLTGNVRRKLNAARAAEGSPHPLDRNVSELEAVQPEPWTAENVTPVMSANWIPPQHYAGFAQHLVGGRTAVTYSDVTNAYHFEGREPDEAKVLNWRTREMPFERIFEGLLNSRVPVVMKPNPNDPSGKSEVRDPEASDLVRQKANEIEQEFANWVFADADRRNELVKIFNDKFNTRVTRQHDGSHLELPGKVPDEIIRLRRHQKNAVWRGIHERTVLYDHVVGSGKTFTAIARAMERRRMGLSRKPMIVVPNHLVEQWASDVYRLYPGAKVISAGANQFDRQNRRRLFAKIATGDHDIVIVPHSSFKFIGISEATERRFLEEELRIAQQAVKDAESAAAEAGIGGRKKPFNVKEAERLATTIETRLASLKSKKDRLLTFEQMGVDDLTVDEAHEFKNLFYSSRLINVRGMGNKSGSEKAFDLYNKVRLLNESPTGSVNFMTGTPISNSAVEMYTMMRYLAANELKDLGLEHFDAWRAQSVSASSAYEPTESGGLKEVTRLGRDWSNMRALMELYYTFADSVPQEDIQKWYAQDNPGQRFPIPDVKGGGRKEVVVQPTPAQEGLLREIVSGFDDLPSISDPDERNIERLKLMDRARKLSLDARAVDPRTPSREEGGKLERIADEVARIHKAWTPDRGTQLVFLDRGVKAGKQDASVIKEYDALVDKQRAAEASGDETGYRQAVEALDRFDPSEIAELRRAQSGGWNAYDQLKENMVARGIPANEIRFVQEANSDAEKKALFDAVNDGIVRVLVGSTPKMGAGTNVQKRLVALHHGDVTYKPSDIEQREGRIIRQGNELLAKYGHDAFKAEILAYVTERTIDAKMWSLNSTKLKMINGIRKYEGAFNMEFEDSDSVGMAEIAALASGDPLMLERVKLKGDIDKLELQERGFRRRLYGIQDQIHSAEQALQDNPDRIKRIRADASAAQDAYQDVAEAATKRTVEVEGKTFRQSLDALEAAKEAASDQQGGDENAKYSVSVGGKRLTNKGDIESAIADALGDERPFEAQIGGRTIIRRSQLAKVIQEAMTPDETKIVGSMRGGDIELRASRVTSTKLVPSIALVKDGRTLGAYNGGNFDADKALSPQGARGLIDGIEKDLDQVAQSTGDYLQDAIDKAKAQLPTLREQEKKPFDKATDLAAKRARLAEVTKELADRTKAAEGGWPAAASGEIPTEGFAEEDTDEKYVKNMGGLRVPASDLPARFAQEHVLTRGAMTGNEHLVAIDERGNIIANMQGNNNYVGVTTEILQRFRDPSSDIVVHHNHPRGTVLSTADVAMLGYLGMRAVWAHGHNGIISRASLTPRARTEMSLLHDSASTAILLAASRDAANLLMTSFNLRIVNGEITRNEADRAHRHLILVAMRNAGVLDYRTNFEAPELTDDPFIRNLVRDAANAVAKRIFKEDRANPDRRTVIFRHVGDVGASFGGAYGDATANAGNWGDGPRGQGNGRVSSRKPSSVGFNEDEMQASFAGVTARTANRDLLAQAQRLASSGATPEKVWKATGWYYRPDGWRFEIDDSKVRFKPLGGESFAERAKRILRHAEPKDVLSEHKQRFSDETGYSYIGKLGGLIDAPDLFKAYPRLESVNVRVGHNSSWVSGATLDPKTLDITVDGGAPKDAIKSGLFHEIQHAVQIIEGFDAGGNSSTMSSRINAALYELSQQIKGLRPGSNIRFELEALRKKLEDGRDLLSGGVAGFAVKDRQTDAYSRLLGEVEARNTEARIKMSAVERAATPPSQTEDTPREEQYRGSDLVTMREKNSGLIDRVVADGFKSSGIDGYEGLNLSGKPQYSGVALEPEGRRSNITQSLHFTPESVADNIRLFGAKAVRDALSGKPDRFRDNARQEMERAGRVAADQEWADPDRSDRVKQLQGFAADHERMARLNEQTIAMLDRIIEQHPELVARPGYDLDRPDSQGLIEKYSGPTYTKEQYDDARRAIEEAIWDLEKRGLISSEEASAFSYDFDAQGFHPGEGADAWHPEAFKTLHENYKDLVDLYRASRDYLAYSSNKENAGLSASIRPSRLSGDHNSAPYRKALEDALTKMIDRMVGLHNVRVRFDDEISLANYSTRGWGDLTAPTAAGGYLPAQKLIRLALADPAYPISGVINTTAHEAYHAIEAQLQTPQERALMERETPRIRELLRKNMDFTDTSGVKHGSEWVDKLEGYEVRALGAELYATARESGQEIPGLHVGVRRWYQRLFDLLRHVGNWLRGLGYKTAEDVYKAAWEGEYAKRSNRDGEVVPRPAPEMQPAMGRRSIRPKRVRPFKERLSDAGTAFIRGAADQMVDVLNLQTAIENATGRRLPDAQKPYLAEALFHGRAGERVADLWDEHVKPIIDDLKVNKVSREDFDDYLIAAHAQWRNARIASINPTIPDGGSGMMNADAQAILNAARANPNFPVIQRNAQRVYDMIDDALNRRVAYGLMTQADANRWQHEFGPNYVPLRGFAEYEGDEPGRTGGGGFSVRGKESKSAMGRGTRADDVLAQSVLQAADAIHRGETNRVWRTFYNLSSAHPDPDLWTITKVETDRRINPTTGMVETYTKNINKGDDNVLVGKINGVEYAIVIHHRELANAMKRLGVDQASWAERYILRPIVTVFSSMRTRWNPEFVLKNFLRDQFDANFAVLALGHGAKANAFYMKQLPAAARAAFGAAFGKPLSPQWTRLYDEFRHEGGKVTWAGSRDIQEIKDKIAARMNEGNIKAAALLIPRFIEKLNEGFETATRLSLYATAKHFGHSPMESASTAREGTINFDRAGAHTAIFRSLFPFFGANTNASLRFLRLLRGVNVGTKVAVGAVRRAAYGMVLGGFLAALYNQWMGGDDDDEKSFWSKVSEYEKRTNIIVMTGGKDQHGRPVYAKMPMFAEAMIFWNLGANIADKITGAVSWGKALGNYLATAVNAIPILGSAHMGMPAAIDAPVSLMLNRNWYDGPIHPDPFPNSAAANLPASQSKFPWTDTGWQTAAEWIGRAGGGDKFRKPTSLLDLHPEDVKYIVGEALGGAANFTLSTADLVRRIAEGVSPADIDIRDYPVLRQYVGHNYASSTNHEFNDTRKSVMEGKAAAGAAIKAEGRGSSTVQDVIRENGPIRTTKTGTAHTQASDIYDAYTKQMAPLNKQADGIRKNTDLPQADREKQLEVIDEKRLAMRKAVLKRIEDIRKRGAAPPN